MGNVNTQDNVDEPGPQLVVEPPPQGLFPSVIYVNPMLTVSHSIATDLYMVLKPARHIG